MHKIIYLIGVYNLCVGLHEAITNMDSTIKSARRMYEELINGKGTCTNHEERKVVGFHEEEEKAYKPMNKIGF